MNEEVIGLIPAAGKGVRLGLPYPKELYREIKGESSNKITILVTALIIFFLQPYLPERPIPEKKYYIDSHVMHKTGEPISVRW